MPEAGVEPARPCGQVILSHPRLPVPPLRLIGIYFISKKLKLAYLVGGKLDMGSGKMHLLSGFTLTLAHAFPPCHC